MTTPPIPSLGAALDSAREKKRRADKHLGALKQSLQRFRDREGYVVNRDLQQGEPHWKMYGDATHPYGPYQVVDHYDIAIKFSLNKTPPILRWGAMIGDVVHNLHSALENIVWELSRAEVDATAPGSGATGDERKAWRGKVSRIGFPACVTEGDWRGSGLDRLWAVDNGARAVIKEMQPFDAWKQRGKDPHLHPLHVLHELWNRDKHRTINLTTSAAYLTATEVRLSDAEPGSPELRTEVVKQWPLRPLEGETEIGVVRVFLPEPLGPVQVHMEHEVGLNVLFSEGAPAVGESAFFLLLHASDMVRYLLTKFA